MELFVEARKSGKSGNTYYCLTLDLGYRIVFLSYSRDLCAEVLGVPVAELFNMKVGDRVKVIKK